MDTEVDVERLRSEFGELHGTKREVEWLVQRKKLIIPERLRITAATRGLPAVQCFENMDVFTYAVTQFASRESRDRIDSGPEPRVQVRKEVRCPPELRVWIPSTGSGRVPLSAHESQRRHGYRHCSLADALGTPVAESGRGRGSARTDKGNSSATSARAARGHGTHHDIAI